MPALSIAIDIYEVWLDICFVYSYYTVFVQFHVATLCTYSGNLMQVT